MRFINPSLLIGCMALTLVGKADAAPWTSAKFPGEQDRAVQGCADDVQNPGDWFCIFVRCEQPRSLLSLHFSAPGPDIHGDIKLVVDEDLFAVSVPTSLKSPLPLSTRAEAIPDALIDAMKAGSTILVQVPTSNHHTIEYHWRTHVKPLKESSGHVRGHIPAPHASGGV
jgi:hypothetical protein